METTRPLASKKRKRSDREEDEEAPKPIVVKKRRTKKDDEAKSIVFTCTKDGCRCAFVDEMSLKRHMKTHEEGFEHVKCTHDGCLRVFETEKEMKKHCRTIHKDGVEKLFVCDVDGCAASYTTRCGLWNHKQSVHYPKEIPCTHDGCDKIFRTKTILRQHILEVHTKREKFKCPYVGCDKFLASKQSLDDHIARHNGTYKYICEDCGKKTITLSELKTHAKTHNKPKKAPRTKSNFREHYNAAAFG